MDMIPLIGIAAQAYSGKDTLCGFLAESHDYEVRAFADPMYEGLQAAMRLPVARIYDKEKEIPGYSKSMRQMAQTLGTEWARRLVNHSIWVHLMRCEILKLIADYPRHQMPKIVISDVRFENEAKFIRDMGGRIVHLSRKDKPEANPHVSEAGLARDPGDMRVSNDGSLDQLREAAYLIAMRAADPKKITSEYGMRQSTASRLIDYEG